MRYFACLLALAMSGGAFAQTQPSSIENRGNIGLNTPQSNSQPKQKLSKPDTQFVRDAINGGRGVNDKSRLALTQGANPAIKEFAKRLMDDHSAQSKTLVALATKGGFSDLMSVTSDYFSARTEVDARTGEKRNRAPDDLSRFSGTAFDKEFAKQITADLQTRVSKFEAAQKSLTNTELQEFAASTLPGLHENLARAQSLVK
jgi:putative membrane protein